MHFFTEPLKLDTQSTNDVFGPVTGSKYKISSKHTLKDTTNPGFPSKLFACQDALLVILPTIDSSNNLVTGKVNLILKPLEALPIRMQPVKYYIFRGVDRDSYLTGSAVIANNIPVNCEFINKLHFNWTASLPLRPPTPPPVLTPKIFGFDESLATDSVKRAFYLEELFNSSSTSTVYLQDFSAVKVREGEWIGNIPDLGSFDFEIITDTENGPITLEYAELESYEIDGSSPVFDPDNPTLETLSIREKVLNYIDPAAFFGMHFDAGIRINNGYSPAGTGIPNNTIATSIKKKQDAYNEVISKFLNKNIVYLDIRSERGYSYGFYQNYQDNSGDILKLKSKSDLFFHNLDYSNVEWPLINLNNPPGNLNALIPGDPIYLKLSTEDNDTPVLFAEDPKLFGTSNKKQFYNQEDIKDLNKKIRLFIPNAIDSSNKVNVACQIKLHYFRELDHPNSPASVFKVTNYLDSVFGGMNNQALIIPTKFNHVQNTKRHFVNGSGFSFVTDTGFYFEGGATPTVMLYSELAYSKDKSSSSYPKISLGTVTNEGVLRHKNVVFSKTPIIVSSITIDLLNIVGYNRTSNETTPKENLHLLGLTKEEWDEILDDTNVSTLSGHQVYLKFMEEVDGSGGPLKDDGGITYRKFKVVATGLDASMAVQQYDTFGSIGNIFVYGFNTTILCSKDFAAVQNVTPYLPDPVNMTEYPDAHLISYTGKTPEVASLFPTGTVVLIDDDFQNISSVYDDKPLLNLVGDIFYPVDSIKGTAISSKGAPFPLILISHGNGHHYTDYRALAKFLAKNGFIVATISHLATEQLLIFNPSDYSTFGATFTHATIPTNTVPNTLDDFFFYEASYKRTIYIYNRLTAKISIIVGEFDSSGTNYVWTDKYDLNWKNESEFLTFITPKSKSWTKVGSAASTNINGFGIEWLTNSGTGSNKKADLIKAGDKMVTLTATQYALDQYTAIKSAIDGEPDTTEIKIPYPDTTVDVYIGTIFNGVYYMAHIKTSALSGTTVTLDVDIKNAQIEFLLGGGKQGLGILGRANNTNPHLQIIKKFMGAHVQNNIGLIGHSRGAEAVVRATTDIAALGSAFKFNINTPNLRSSPDWKNVPNDLDNIKAVASLAPTDSIGAVGKNSSKVVQPAVSIQHNVPYYVLYGSREGDVIGSPNPSPPDLSLSNKNRNSGFSIYDRSINQTEKSMTFVYGATHNGFITDDHDYEYFVYKYFDGVKSGTPLDITKQKDIAKGYFNALMRMYLKNEDYWKPYFTGEVIPLAIKNEDVFQQYRNMNAVAGKWYDDLSAVPDTSLSGIGISTTIPYTTFPSISATRIGGRIISIDVPSSALTTLGAFVHSDLVDFAKFDTGSGVKKALTSPHESNGLFVDWNTTMNSLRIDVDKNDPNGTQDATLFGYLSFRVGHVVNFKSGHSYEDLSKVIVKLEDLSSQTSETQINKGIPIPYIREDFVTKSAMMTIRLPLDSFIGTADLTVIKYVILELPGSGTLVINDFEFTD